MFRKFKGFFANGAPPDLDQVLNELKRKIQGFFGKQKRQLSSQGSGQNNPVAISGVVVFATLIVVWIATGFYIVDQGWRGIVLRFGKHVETTLPGPRWHLPYPIESVEQVNIEQVRTIEIGYRSVDGNENKTRSLQESLMLTDDENIVDLQIAMQYNLKNAESYLFNNRSNEDAVRSVAEAAIREVVGKSRLDFVLYEGRDEIAVHTKQLMQEILDRYRTGINIVGVTMQNAQPPEQVQAAFEDAVKAKQDMERQKNEGYAYANDVIPKARGTASRLLQEAEGYQVRVENEAQGNVSRFNQIFTQYTSAPDVTRKRLYLEMQEQILSSVNKIVVDQKNGNSLLYLPLDKILHQENEPKTFNSGQQNLTPQTLLPNVQDLRGRERGR